MSWSSSRTICRCELTCCRMEIFSAAESNFVLKYFDDRGAQVLYSIILMSIKIAGYIFNVRIIVKNACF